MVHQLNPHGASLAHDAGHPQLLIHTLEGVMRANFGDWIIRGVKGEFYPCKPEIFEATYEPVSCALLWPEDSRALAEETEALGTFPAPPPARALFADEVR